MRKKIILLVILNIFIILVSLGVISYLSVNDSIAKSLKERLALADTVARYIDLKIENNLVRLHDISIQGIIGLKKTGKSQLRISLKRAYEYSIFTDGVFFLDASGNVVLTYPGKISEEINILSVPYVRKAITEGKPLVSNIYTVGPMKKVIFALMPLKDASGRIIGAVGGEINPASAVFTQIIEPIGVKEGMVIDLVDSYGTVIASSNQKLMFSSSDHNKFLRNLIEKKKDFVGVCHRCHIGEKAKGRTSDMLAFAPLSAAPWGVSIREPRESVFSPALRLRKGFMVLSVISILTALFVAVGLSRSMVKPVQALISATSKIGEDNLCLSEPIMVAAKDEIGTLAQSFDRMRIKLADALESIRNHNLQLENRILNRTKALEESRKKLSILFEKVISAQEEERKRVARELHDDTCQVLNAMLLRLDLLSMSLVSSAGINKDLNEIRQQALTILGGIQRMIKDLRPPVLDDFGLEHAIEWLLERHFREKGIKFQFNVKSTCRDAQERGELFDCAKLEHMLFRVIQEAVINISRHADAKNAYVSLEFKDAGVAIEIQDDGKGFEVGKVLESNQPQGGSGFGLLGMKERIALLDGNINICSRPGEGTFVSIFVPIINEHIRADN